MTNISSATASGRPRRWAIELVGKVGRRYSRTRSLQPVVHTNLDETPGAQSSRWTPDSCHYCVDVIRSVKFAIKDQPDAKELAKAWLIFLEDGSPVPETWAKLVCLLGPVFNERGLEPKHYFRPIRRRSA